MIIRITGAVLILIGCGGVGFMLSALHRKSEKAMQQLITALECMEYELQYRQSPLPDMLRRAVAEDGVIKNYFHLLAAELEGQIAPNVERCVAAAFEKIRDIPKLPEEGIKKFGQCIGRFDLEMQVKGLKTVREECVRMLTKHIENQDVRLRNYHTLALCAGAALVIFLL